MSTREEGWCGSHAGLQRHCARHYTCDAEHGLTESEPAFLSCVCVQIIFLCLALVDDMKPIMAACESLGHFISSIMRQLANSEPVAPSSRPGHLSSSLRLNACDFAGFVAGSRGLTYV